MFSGKEKGGKISAKGMSNTSGGKKKIEANPFMGRNETRKKKAIFPGVLRWEGGVPNQTEKRGVRPSEIAGGGVSNEKIDFEEKKWFSREKGEKLNSFLKKKEGGQKTKFLPKKECAMGTP